MKRIDHIAICVSSPIEAADWYVKNHGATKIFADDTWAIVQFQNIKLAFVIKEQHPPHFAFEVDNLDAGNLHRDGSVSVYKTDPWGNEYELVKYPER
jgi:hypothetical protein